MRKYFKTTALILSAVPERFQERDGVISPIAQLERGYQAPALCPWFANALEKGSLAPTILDRGRKIDCGGMRRGGSAAYQDRELFLAQRGETQFDCILSDVPGHPVLFEKPIGVFSVDSTSDSNKIYMNSSLIREKCLFV
ncbi:hypothetical protein F1559_001904 [Cyanidiococcus yangmingshanensis]|uniref:Uncharacterized protein n=1 Tax=Cyanidiococcus yangmingshanensis TaxID=2690220 RepID=A0A7J7IEG5_9RHOD|nr:hypothetical protein F1559_001904 [Cyanidiococcus yangmingshanensis]